MQLDHFTIDRWRALVTRMSLDIDVEAEFARLETAHAEPHRAYHTAAHIDDCLARLDEVRALCGRPDEVEFALWLHDAIYRTRGGDSERQSAAWAIELLRAGGAGEDTIVRVETLILATTHNAEPELGDAALLVDIDLSILGRDASHFDEYEEEVRREYSWVPGPLFRRRRSELLEAFLARPRLYATDHFHATLEEPARLNLARSIARLR